LCALIDSAIVEGKRKCYEKRVTRYVFPRAYVTVHVWASLTRMTVSESCLPIFRLARVDPKHSLSLLVSSILYSGPHDIRARDTMAPTCVGIVPGIQLHVAQHEE